MAALLHIVIIQLPKNEKMKRFPKNMMKRFPKNLEQQAVWVKIINRDDWVPTNNSLLCEVITFEFFTIR